MGIYTENNAPEVDATIDRHMNLLAGICTSTLGSNLHSLVLAGSFGRGEGSALVGEDGSVQPLRDYDLRVILQNHVAPAIIERIRREFMETTGLGHADEHFSGEDGFSITLEPLTQAQLAGSFVRDHDLRAYDHLTASRIIWGEDNPANLRFPACDIPKVNGIRFLYQKMVGLVGHYEGADVSNSATSRTLTYECSKTYIEICTALCLLADSYVASYRARAELFSANWQRWFPELAQELPDLGRDVLQATAEKLHPGSTPALPLNLAFYGAQHALLVTHKHYLRSLYGVEIEQGNAGCARLLKTLKTHYFWGAIANRLQDRHVNNWASRWLVNEAYGRGLRIKYVRAKGGSVAGALGHAEAPNIDIFVAAWCLLGALSWAGTAACKPDNTQIDLAQRVLRRLPGHSQTLASSRQGGWEKYRLVREEMIGAYQKWEQK